MKKTFIIFVALLVLLFGATTLNETKAQMFMYYEPYELFEAEEEESEELEVANVGNSFSENSSLIWAAVAVWVVVGCVAWRLNRIRKNKQRRVYMERFRQWNLDRYVAVIGLLLCFAIPTKAQMYLDEETRERTMISNMPNVSKHKIKGNEKGMYAPLGGEVLVFGLLGGAYLIGKRSRKEEDK